MSDGATVIQFPKKHIRPEILNDEVAKSHEAGKVYFVGEMTARYCEQAIEGLVSFGVDVDDQKFTKDIAYLATVACGIFSKQADLEHSIHIIVNGGAEIMDSEGNILGYSWSMGNVANAPTAVTVTTPSISAAE